jgi:hypothetical protein
MTGSKALAEYIRNDTVENHVQNIMGRFRYFVMEILMDYGMGGACGSLVG